MLFINRKDCKVFRKKVKIEICHCRTTIKESHIKKNPLQNRRGFFISPLLTLVHLSICSLISAVVFSSTSSCLYQLIFRDTNIITPKITNKPMLPINNE